MIQVSLLLVETLERSFSRQREERGVNSDSLVQGTVLSFGSAGRIQQRHEISVTESITLTEIVTDGAQSTSRSTS
jgi:hypothetical protein